MRKPLNDDERVARALADFTDEQWSMVLSEVASLEPGAGLCCSDVQEWRRRTITGRKREQAALRTLCYEHAGCGGPSQPDVEDSVAHWRRYRDYYPDNVLYFAGQGASIYDDKTHGKVIDTTEPVGPTVVVPPPPVVAWNPRPTLFGRR